MTGNRKSLRIANYDYSTPGSYFVTICLNDRKPILSSVDDSGVQLSDIGLMISKVWNSIPQRFSTVILNAFAVMPDHIHGIVFLDISNKENEFPTLGSVMGMFKSVTTNKYIAGVNEANWPRFSRQLWQTGYRDHIIRDDRDLWARQLYIERNPGRWLENRDSL